MIDNALATTSLLVKQYGLFQGNSAVSALLGPQKDTAFSGLALLQDATAQGTEQNLTEFVKQYVPNNGKLLQDLSAVFALQGLAGKSELPATAAFLNPYSKALALQTAGVQDEAASSLISMLL